METVDRVYVKRTRRGQVKTFVRQQYLRDDLPTGSPHLDGPEHGEPRQSFACQYDSICSHTSQRVMQRPCLRQSVCTARGIIPIL